MSTYMVFHHTTTAPCAPQMAQIPPEQISPLHNEQVNINTEIPGDSRYVTGRQGGAAGAPGPG